MYLLPYYKHYNELLQTMPLENDAIRKTNCKETKDTQKVSP